MLKLDCAPLWPAVFVLFGAENASVWPKLVVNRVPSSEEDQAGFYTGGGETPEYPPLDLLSPPLDFGH